MINRPDLNISVDIPEQWLSFCEFVPLSHTTPYYPYTAAEGVVIIPLKEIEPPSRSRGIEPFKKYKLAPVLLGLSNPEIYLPPVVVTEIASANGYRYKLFNGFHRFYASVAAGFTHIPAVVRPEA